MAKQAANEMVLKEVDTFLSDQRISLAVVTFQTKMATLTLWPDQAHGGISVLWASLSRQRVQLFSQNWRLSKDYTRQPADCCHQGGHFAWRGQSEAREGSGPVGELKTHSAQPRRRRDWRKRRRQNTRRRSGTRCKWKVKKTFGQAWAWKKPKTVLHAQAQTRIAVR